MKHYSKWFLLFFIGLTFFAGLQTDALAAVVVVIPKFNTFSINSQVSSKITECTPCSSTNFSTIAVTMPYGTTDVTKLVATFSTDGGASYTVIVNPGGSTQYSAVTSNDFTSPVKYTVIAAPDGMSFQTYTVTVKIAPGITAFTIPGQQGTTNIDQAARTIKVTMPYTTSSLNGLMASFVTSDAGATVTIGSTVQYSGVTANDFTSPLTYTVTAVDGTTQNYSVTVTVAPAITAFSISGQIGTIDQTAQTIKVTMPYTTSSLNPLVASFTPSLGSSVKVGSTAQTSGVTGNDFTSTVTYIVTASDNTTQNYNVTVTVAPGITVFTIPNQQGSTVFDQAANPRTIKVTMPYGTSSLNPLVASFTPSLGSSVNVGSTAQTSGVTGNDFTSTVTYIVTASDNTTQNYNVTVTVAPGITDFTIPGQQGSTVFDQTLHTIAVAMPYTITDLTALVASFITSPAGQTVTVGSTIQNSGITANNFTNSTTTPVRYTVTKTDGTTNYYDVSVRTALPNSTAITSFTIPNQQGATVIDKTTNPGTIKVTMPYGTSTLNGLVASFASDGSVKVGLTVQNSGVTANDFTSPVTYTVTAVDTITTQDYLVTVTVAPGITDFTIPGQQGSTTISQTAHTIAVTMPYTTSSLNGLVASFTTSPAGQTVTVGSTTQISGTTPNDFRNTVRYTVTKTNGTANYYDVTVTIAPAITAFSISTPVQQSSSINQTAHTIAVTMPYGTTDLTALVATFTASPGSSVKVGSTTQTSGVTANDFTRSVTYTVTAADGSTQDYLVSVTVGLNPAKAITAFTIPGQQGTTVIDQGAHTIAVTMPCGTNVTALVPSFTATGVSVKVGSTVQVSETTPNNFTSPVIYTVFAADGSTQDYTATVCTYCLSKSNDSFLAAGGNGSITVITAGTGCSWTAVSNAGWLHTSSSGTGDGAVSYSVDAYTGTNSRNGTITIKGETLSILQAPPPSSATCNYVIAPYNAIYTSGVGTGSVDVKADDGCDWTAVSNNASWIQVTGGASGTGTGTVSYTVLANSDTSSRLGTISIFNNVNVTAWTFTITQDGTGGSTAVTVTPSSPDKSAVFANATVITTDNVEGIPSALNFNATGVLSFTASEITKTAATVCFSPIPVTPPPATPAFYKFVNGTWVQIYPPNDVSSIYGITNASFDGTKLCFTITDNSEADGCSELGIIQDPITIGTAAPVTTTTITYSGGGGHGGGNNSTITTTVTTTIPAGTTTTVPASTTTTTAANNTTTTTTASTECKIISIQPSGIRIGLGLIPRIRRVTVTMNTDLASLGITCADLTIQNAPAGVRIISCSVAGDTIQATILFWGVQPGTYNINIGSCGSIPFVVSGF